MKASIFLFAIIALIAISCSSNNNYDIAGTYVTQFQNEYSITADTIIISELGGSNQSYEVIRKTGFKKIRNGKTLNKEFKEVKWASSYDNNKRLLQESDLGRRIYVLPDKHELKLGSSEYIKAK